MSYGLTHPEGEIMNTLFALANRASAEKARACWSRQPGYPAVRLMLTRLQAKGSVMHKQEGIHTSNRARFRRVMVGALSYGHTCRPFSVPRQNTRWRLLLSRWC